jgi:hypothetical protein
VRRDGLVILLADEELASPVFIVTKRWRLRTVLRVNRGSLFSSPGMSWWAGTGAHFLGATGDPKLW